MKQFGLSKQSKLRSLTAIESLFRGGKHIDSIFAFPIKAVWRANHERPDGSTALQMLPSMPKKRLRHAVDRVTMRRRTREAFRLIRHRFDNLEGHSIDLMFIYVADKPLPYSHISRAMTKILHKVDQWAAQQPDSQHGIDNQ